MVLIMYARIRLYHDTDSKISALKKQKNKNKKTLPNKITETYLSYLRMLIFLQEQKCRINRV